MYDAFEDPGISDCLLIGANLDDPAVHIPGVTDLIDPESGTELADELCDFHGFDCDCQPKVWVDYFTRKPIPVSYTHLTLPTICSV